jgi:hypothetical protein
VPSSGTDHGITAAARSQNNAATGCGRRREYAATDLVEGSIPADSDDPSIETLASPRFRHLASVPNVFSGHELNTDVGGQLQLPKRSLRHAAGSPRERIAVCNDEHRSLVGSR